MPIHAFISSFTPSLPSSRPLISRSTPKASANSDPAILTIDVGTSATKAALFHLNPSRLSPPSRHSYKTSTPYPFHVTQIPTDWLESTIKCSRQVLQNKTPVLAVSITGQMQTLSATGHPPSLLSNSALLYSDARAQNFAQDLQLPATSIPPKLKLLSHHGDYRLFLGATDYILHAFASNEHKPFVTDPTTASTTALTLPPHRVYNEQLLHNADLEAFLPKLPSVLPRPCICGHLSAEVAALLNRADLAGIPLIHAGGDAYSTTVGAGCDTPGATYVYIGTSGWVARTSGEASIENGLFSLGHFEQADMNIVAASVASAGGALEYGCKQLLHVDITELDSLARKSEAGAKGVTFVPYIQGRRCPRPNAVARGGLIGIGEGVGKEDVARAIVEGVGYALMEAGEVLGDVDEVVVVGGGSKCESLMEVLAGQWKVRKGGVEAGLRGAGTIASRVLGIKVEKSGEEEAIQGASGLEEGWERWRAGVRCMETMWNGSN